MSNSITDGESERPSSLCRPRLLIPSLFLSPGGGGMTGIRHQISTISVLLGLLGRFLALPERASKTTSKKHRKKRENRGFWPPKPLPKPFQNPIKTEVPKNMRFFIEFCSNFDACCKSRTSKFMRPASVLLVFHTIRLIAFGMHFWSKKPTENPSKTGSEPFQNRCQKHVVF